MTRVTIEEFPQRPHFSGLIAPGSSHLGEAEVGFRRPLAGAPSNGPIQLLGGVDVPELLEANGGGRELCGACWLAVRVFLSDMQI
jgi:hypothetical protein